MDVEVITDKMPTRDLRISGDDGLGMRQKIILSARGPTGGGQDLTCYHITAHDHRARPMAEIFKLSPFDFVRSQRQSRVLAFQGLDSCQFVWTHRVLTLLGQSWGV